MIYTTPLKALSNQKLHEMRAQFGFDRVGLQTGDGSLNSEGDVVIMTTEVLRNILFRIAAEDEGNHIPFGLLLTIILVCCTASTTLWCCLSLQNLCRVVWRKVWYIMEPLVCSLSSTLNQCPHLQAAGNGTSNGVMPFQGHIRAQRSPF